MTVQEALCFATKAHGDQRERTGTPYIFHCVRVAQRVAGDDLTVMTALLHDVLEDTKTTEEDLRKAGFHNIVINNVKALTRIPGEDYQVMLDRVKQDYFTIVIKMADIEDHLDIMRDIRGDYTWSDKDALRIKKYAYAYQQLLGAKAWFDSRD